MAPELTKSERDRRQSAGGRKLHDIKVIVQRMTDKAYLLAPAETANAIEGEACWFAKSLVQLDVDDASAASASWPAKMVIATLPEWLLIEKGWENYVKAT